MIATSYYCLIFLLIFSPPAFGTVDTLPQLLTQAACFGGLFLFSLSTLLSKGGKACRLPGLTPVLLLLGFLFFQIIPFPIELLKILSPAAYGLHLGPTGTDVSQAWSPVTINSSATFTQIFYYASLLSCYILAGFLFKDKARCRQAIWLLIVIGTIIATQGILQKWFDNGRLLWLRLPPVNGGYFKGAFVHRNQFAAYLEMLAPLALAFSFFHQPHINKVVTFRQRCVETFGQPLNNFRLFLGLSAVFMVTACYISTSRGGILSVTVVCMLLTFFLRPHGKNETIFIRLGIILFCIAFLVGYTGWEPIVSRFYLKGRDVIQISSGRLDIWNQSLPLIKDFFLTGSGLGTFSNIFTSYSTFDIYPNSFIYHPHNTYIEAFSDLGLIGCTLLGCFFYSVGSKAYAGYRQRRDRFARYLFIGAAAGLCAQLLHMTVEYNLQSGAVGLTFFTLLALLVSGGHTRFHGHGAPSSLPGTGSGPMLVLVIVSGLSLAGSLYWNISTMSAYTVLPGPMTWNRDTPRVELEAIHERAVRASHIMPLHSYYHFARADTASLLGLHDEAREQYLRAIRLNPAMPAYLEGFGFFLAGEGKDEQADRFLALAIRHDRANAKRYQRYGNWLLASGRREKALAVFAQAMQVAPQASKTIIPLLVGVGCTPESIRSILPERVRPYLVLAKIVADKGQMKEAENLYAHALELVATEPKIRGWFFNAPFQFYRKQNLPARALAVLEQGIELLPDDVGLRMKLARLYEQQGDTDKAVAAYRQVLVLKPGQQEAEGRLKGIWKHLNP